MAFQHVIIDTRDGIALITLNRPSALNALNRALIAELDEVFRQVAADPGVRVVILTGSGEKAFVAGADISELAGFDCLQARTFAAEGQGMMARIAELPMPVIAAVNGFALGGGCELALACDFIYACDSASFGLPEETLGLIPGFGGTQRLARRVGEAMALELILTARRIRAEEARAMGLVNRVVPSNRLMDETMEMARKIAAMAPMAVTLAKDAVRKGMQVDLASGCHLEKEAFSLCFASADAQEGTAAFLEKRKPLFSTTRDACIKEGTPGRAA